MTPYDVCIRCGRDIIDSEMKEEELCQKCTQQFIDDCLEADAAQEVKDNQ